MQFQRSLERNSLQATWHVSSDLFHKIWLRVAQIKDRSFVRINIIIYVLLLTHGRSNVLNVHFGRKVRRHGYSWINWRHAYSRRRRSKKRTRNIVMNTQANTPMLSSPTNDWNMRQTAHVDWRLAEWLPAGSCSPYIRLWWFLIRLSWKKCQQTQCAAEVLCATYLFLPHHLRMLDAE